MVMYLFKKNRARAERNKAERCKVTKKRSSKIKDCEKIIKIQEEIIKSRNRTFDAYDQILEFAMLKVQSVEQEMQDAYKDRNEAIRRYNALHQLGEMAEAAGVDLTAKLPENQKTDWDPAYFKVNAKVLESGKTNYSITTKLKKSRKQQGFPKLHKRRKKKSL